MSILPASESRVLVVIQSEGAITGCFSSSGDSTRLDHPILISLSSSRCREVDIDLALFLEIHRFGLFGHNFESCPA